MLPPLPTSARLAAAILLLTAPAAAEHRLADARRAEAPAFVAASAGPLLPRLGPAALDAAGLDRFYDRRRPGPGEIPEPAGAPFDAAPGPAERGAAAEAAGARLGGAGFPAAVFSDRASIQEQLIRAIERTEASIKLVLYDFNQPETLAALRRALERTPPVQVEVLLDSSHTHPANGKPRSPEIQALLDEPRIRLRILRGMDQYGTMHNKFALFDDRMVVYGSYNWTRAAEGRHHENVLFSNDPQRVGRYGSYWTWMWERSSPPDAAAPEPQLGTGPPRDRAPSVRFHDQLFPAVVFSPRGGTAQWLLKAIRRSERAVDVAMFSFFHQELADALLERKRAGVAVRLVLDARQAANSPVTKFFAQHGFAMRLASGRAALGVMHHKFAVFDGRLVETGSYNWTNNGEHNNFENANFLREPEIVQEFSDAFERLWSAAAPAGERSAAAPGERSPAAPGERLPAASGR